ncbi:hypothetical protein QSH65_24580, partial [Escherichia coli]|uniref:hypothetical protein n=1 Tax=Escherichia coli TaxID=562 RepID=UPI00273808D7
MPYDSQPHSGIISALFFYIPNNIEYFNIEKFVALLRRFHNGVQLQRENVEEDESNVLLFMEILNNNFMEKRTVDILGITE